MASFTIALTSDALFRVEGENTVTGPAFPFVKALTMINQRLGELSQAIEEQFNIVLMTNNQDRNRLKRSIRSNHLNIDQIYEITAEKDFLEHLNDLKPVLYLSTDSENVKAAINAGYGAATMFQKEYTELSYETLRVVFDGDGVLFSDESERVYKEQGIEAFFQNETDLVDTALSLGPLSKFAKAILQVQKRFKNKNPSPIRTYLVTSRSTGSAGIRGLKSLQECGLNTNEAFFLSGAEKGPVLKAIKPHIFLDDQKQYIDEALNSGVVGAHVPFGVRNE